MSWFPLPVFYPDDSIAFFVVYGIGAVLIVGSSLVTGWRIGVFLALATMRPWVSEAGAWFGLLAGLGGAYSLFI